MKLSTAILLLPSAVAFIVPIQKQQHARRRTTPSALRASYVSEDAAVNTVVHENKVTGALNAELDNFFEKDELSDTNFNAVLEEIEALATDSIIQIDELLGEVSQKDHEIEQLSGERDNLYSAMDKLKFILSGLESALEKSDEKIEQLERDEESQAKQVRLVSDTLVQVKADSEEEISKLKKEAAATKSKLEKERNALQTMRDDALAKVAFAEATTLKARQEMEQTIFRQKEESKNFERKMRGLVAGEKKIIKQQMWDLETKLKSVQYKRLVANNEVKSLKKVISQLQMKIADLEASHAEEMNEMMQRLSANEMFYARNKYTARKRLVSMVEKFQRRMKRRQERANTGTQDLRIAIESGFNEERNNLIASFRAREMEAEDGMETLRLQLQSEFDEERNELIANFQAREEDANANAEDLRIELESEFEGERNELIAEHYAKEEESGINMETLRIELENDFEAERSELIAGYEAKEEDSRIEMDTLRIELENDFEAERNELIAGYEAKFSEIKMQALQAAILDQPIVKETEKSLLPGGKVITITPESSLMVSFKFLLV